MPEEKIPPLNPITQEVSLCFVGDIIPHKMIVYEKKKDSEKLKNKFLGLFSHVSNEISSVDIAFGNMEGPCADQKLKRKHKMAFNAPYEFNWAMKESGFDILNIANNHAMDCKHEGFKQTIHNLKKLSFRVTGYTTNDRSVFTIIETNDIKIGFMGFTTLLNWSLPKDKKTNLSFFKDLDDSLDIIKEADKEVDYLILSIHWGKEYDTRYKEIKKSARKLFAAGVDCIIGHHPHILLPVEYEKDSAGYRNIVAYSLGDFMANIGREYKPLKSPKAEGNPRRSVILKLVLMKTNNRVLAKKLESVPVWIHNNYYAFRKGKEKKRLIYPLLMEDCPIKILSKTAQTFELKQIRKSLKMDEEK
ncbi:MAG: CapA family protein [Spirochaetes bacterium]|nr:CapA family protein [Spirochaetota bacterium]